MKKQHIFSLAALAVVLAAIAGMAAALLSSEAAVLFRIQELSLWVPTRHFLDTCLIYPGGLLTWAGAFMTQFFYHPTLGVTLLALAWAAIALLTTAVFRLRRANVLLSLLPALALLAALTQTGYWIYYMKLQGWAWVPTLGVLVSLLLCLRPQNRILDWLLLLAVGAFGYPLLGAWSFLSLALLAATSRQTTEAGGRWISRCAMPVAALVLMGIAPQLWYQWGYTQVEHSQIYRAAMPCFQYGLSDMDEFRSPYYALALGFLLCAAASVMRLRPRKSVISSIIPLCLVALAAWGSYSRWYRDTNFHKEVTMMNQIEQLDWEGALRTMRSNDMGEQMPPTRLMVMLKNLSLFRLGRAGDEMFHYPEGAEQYCMCGRRVSTEGDEELKHADGKDHGHTAVPVRITQVGGKMLYYFYGKEQFAYRWCMEDGVEFGWNVLALKYMTKTSIITHDWKVAQKYIEILKKTRYHRDWALFHEQLVGHPERMAENEEMRTIIPMAQFPDRLDGDMTLVEMYLLRTFSSGTGADQWYQEMTLICAMIMKDIELFWPRFRQYVNMHQAEEGFRVPTHYQEAAFLYSMLEPQRESLMWPGLTNAQAAEKIPFDPQVKQSYAEFMQFNTQCGSMSEEQKKKAFYPRFGSTFYYFYFLVRGQKTN